MSGLFGGKKAKSQGTKAVSALQVQTSTFGPVLPLIYGKNRVAGNLGWYGNWVAIAHTEKQSSGGKGGGGSQTSTSYTYATGVILLLGEGPINGVGTVWKDKELHSLSDLGFTLFNGTTPQSPWTWLTSYNSSQAIAYNGIAYAAASSLQLGSSTGLPNLNFEVKGLQLYNPGVVDDALPSDILTDYLTDTVHGAGFGGYLGSTAQLRAYCLARGLFLSPIEDQQRTAADFVNDMAKWCNFAPVWSYNQLMLLPYGDTAITGTYGTYTPNVTPIYDLGPNDFLYEDGSECGVELDQKELEQCHNSVRIEYNDRNNSYNTVSQEAKDQADIDARGPFPMSSISVNGITSAQVARDVAQLTLQRDLYIRKQYHFRTDMRYMLLEPMDIVTLTDANAGLNRELVRITSVTEQDDYMEFEAEELPIGVAHAPQYAPQNSGGYSQDFNVFPGSVSPPVIFNAPGMLTPTGFETWIAVAGASQWWGGCDVYVSEDNTTYQRVGRITGAARYGALTAALPSGNDPDTVNTARVSIVRGQLNSGTQADADNWRQLAFVGGTNGGEFIAFQTATLTGTLAYQLSYLRRGGYGSQPQAHVSNDVFVRIDEAIFRLPYDQGKRGNTVYFKFLSFNVFGGAMESLASVTAYSHVLGASDVLASPKLYDQLAGLYPTASSGSNFVPNPGFELNSINAVQNLTSIGQPICDAWKIGTNDGSLFQFSRQTAHIDIGVASSRITLAQNVSLAAGQGYGGRLYSAPIYVKSGQQLSISGDISTNASASLPAWMTATASIGLFYFDQNNTLIGSSYAPSVTTVTGGFTAVKSGQLTVPSGVSYAVAVCEIVVTNTSGSTGNTGANSYWQADFDNLLGQFITAADQVNYTTGQSVDSLKPAQAGADVTSTQTLVGIVNPQFEQGLTGWTPEADAANWYAETGTNGPISGTQNYCVHHDSGTTSYLRNAYRCPVSPGQVIKGQLIVRGLGNPTGTANVRLLWQDASGADISSSIGTTLVGNGVKTLTVIGTAPSNAAFCQINPGVGFASGTLGYYTFDNVQWSAQPATVDEVPDGSTYARPRAGQLNNGVIALLGTGRNPIFNSTFTANTLAIAVNTAVNSGFNYDGWNVTGTGTYSTTIHYNGGVATRISTGFAIPNGYANGPTIQSTNFSVVAGANFAFRTNTSAGVSGTSAPSGVTFNARVLLQFLNSSGSLVSNTIYDTPFTSSFAAGTSTYTGTVPSGATQANVQLSIYTANTGSSTTLTGTNAYVEAGFWSLEYVQQTNLGNEVGGTLSTQRNLPTVTFGNYGSGWNGLSFSYTATTTSATISASAATLQAGSDTVSYNASSVSVTGSAGATVKYYLYYDDPLLSGGSQTLQATTNNITAMAYNGRLFLGTASVTYPTSGTGGGSGGGNCVAVDSWLPGHGEAGEIAVGDMLELVEDAATFRRRAGRVTYAVRKLAPCVRLITESGIRLDCSRTAPILCSDESLVLAPDLLGLAIPVSDFGDHRHERVVAIEDLGEREVIHITCENSVFLAGGERGRYVGHHNLKPG